MAFGFSPPGAPVTPPPPPHLPTSTSTTVSPPASASKAPSYLPPGLRTPTTASPPPPAVTESSLRRHHTVSSTRRPVRRNLLETTDEFIEHRLARHYETAGPGVVSSGPASPIGPPADGSPGFGVAGTGLHRAGSLPNRGFRGAFARAPRPDTASALSRSSSLLKQKNSLSVITAGEPSSASEDWERDIEAARADPDAALSSSLPAFGGGFVAGVRRHASLTYGQRRRERERVAAEDEDDFLPPTSPYGDGGVWGAPRRRSGSGSTILDLHRSFAALDISAPPPPPVPAIPPQHITPPLASSQPATTASPPAAHLPTTASATGTSPLPRPFSPPFHHPPPPHSHSPTPPSSSRKLQLITDFSNMPPQRGPASAAAFVPPIGHSRTAAAESPIFPRAAAAQGIPTAYAKPFSATASVWNERDAIVGPRAGYDEPPHVLLQQLQHQHQQNLPHHPPPQNQWRFDPMTGHALPHPPPMPSINTALLSGTGGGGGPAPFPMLDNATNGFHQPLASQQQQAPLPQLAQQQGQGAQEPLNLMSPIDVPTLIAQNGYNPRVFDTKPAYARYFVIKSYTEDDVHKSLKYNIWASTELGNQRLDRAFKESADKGPIYLFFSVNASGHFCGVAQMLTQVDYTTSSSVWAQDGKWKGVFKVRWIFVKDIPNSSLRHIRLNNTQERKPVTNSRDTTELLPDAGTEMLRIFHTHPARTSLLQDFAFYELQSLQRHQQQHLTARTASPAGSGSGSTGSHSPQPQLGGPPAGAGAGVTNGFGGAGGNARRAQNVSLPNGIGAGIGVGGYGRF